MLVTLIVVAVVILTIPLTWYIIAPVLFGAKPFTSPEKVAEDRFNKRQRR